ncbi:hypothetical protein F4859DRAFT_515755 [Xylaria cf. heliscus]|nr:hypothetical protein F4859DRAFT_515755 [Xylaria cf. heliscus]
MPKVRTGLPPKRRARKPKNWVGAAAEGDDAKDKTRADVFDGDNNGAAPGPSELRLPIRSVEHDIDIDNPFAADDDLDIGDAPPDPNDNGWETKDEIEGLNIEHVSNNATTVRDNDRTVRPRPKDIIGAVNYNEGSNKAPEPKPFNKANRDIEISISDEEARAPVVLPAPESVYQLPHGQPLASDTSVLVEMRQNKYIKTSRFKKFLATYADLQGLSRTEWTMLREGLHLLKDKNGDVLPEIKELPKQLSTLLSRHRKRLPLINMREAEVPLKAEKMPSVARQRRQETLERLKARARGEKPKKRTRKRKSAGDEEAEAQDEVLATAKLTYFDPPSMFKAYISSDIMNQVYQGPGCFVDYPKEFFESRAWTSSNRASQGVYPHMPLGERGVVYAGDDIYYRCVDETCFCHKIDNNSSEVTSLHIGRVVGFGWDLRENSCTDKSKDVLALQIQQYLYQDTVAELLIDFEFEPPVAEDELFLYACHTPVYIPETNAYSHLPIYKDYEFGECKESPGLPRIGRGKKKDYPKYTAPAVAFMRDDAQQNMVRRVIIEHWNTEGDLMRNVVPLCHTHPIRGELELDYYGRDISLMGYYVTPCGLSAKDRFRPGNIVPLVLGPHGSDFGDVIKGLGTLADLDQGVKVTIKGQEVLLCVWTMVFIGDMPQQAENSGFKGPRAFRYCRGCYIGAGQKDIDLELHGRYHHQVLHMRYEMEHLSGSNREDYGQQWGLNTPHPALETIAPALDIILTRPYDPCHSEFAGLFNLAHFLLRDGILTADAVQDYTLQLRAFQFPPGSRRLQSPKHHLSSYEMSAHALWGKIIPIFLRGWLRPSHLKQSFIAQAQDTVDNPVDFIVAAFTAMAKSATVLMGNSAHQDDYKKLSHLVYAGRNAFNHLCHIATLASSRAGSRAGSVTSRAPTVGPEQPEQQEQPMILYMKDTMRPNMHIASHYHDFAAEYAMMVNCNVLTGEDLHRWFKRRVYETNYSNIEKVLLTKINSQITLRLVLRNAFRHDDPGLTDDVQALYKHCPTLFKRALARSDQNELEQEAQAAQDQDDFELDIPVSANDSHQDPSIINKIPTKEMRVVTHTIQGDRSLPLRAGQMSESFLADLRIAYQNDYDKPDYWPSAYDHQEETERFVFSKGEAVMYHGTNFGLIDHIFLFDVYGERHIFLIITPLERTGELDHILGLEIMREQEETPLIVGITAIEPQQPYIIDVPGIGYIHNNWDIKTL